MRLNLSAYYICTDIMSKLKGGILNYLESPKINKRKRANPNINCFTQSIQKLIFA